MQRNITAEACMLRLILLFHAANCVKLKCSNANITRQQYINIILIHTLLD